MLAEHVGLGLPRDLDRTLLKALVDYIGDDQWCEYDWLSLDPDESLKSSWETFCDVVKYSRRFFFHDVGERGPFHRDERSPAQFFNELGRLIEALDLIRTESSGYTLYRARIRQDDKPLDTPLDLGPPPAEFATQSNRMNPPGISMFYGADNEALAMAETRGERVSIGRFETLRPVRILDLANLPEAPGFFTEAYRMEIFTLSFIQEFASIIIRPVPRNDRTQIEYIPTQVFTEFLRDYPFAEGAIDGIRYKSATGEPGMNVVLFASPLNVADGAPDLEFAPKAERWLRLESVQHAKG